MNISTDVVNRTGHSTENGNNQMKYTILFSMIDLRFKSKYEYIKHSIISQNLNE